MPTQGYVSADTYWCYYPALQCEHNSAAGVLGYYGEGLRLTLGVDNEAGLAWLMDALASGNVL
jgi:hypothetical protein